MYHSYYDTIYDDFVDANAEYISNIRRQHDDNIEMINSIAVQLGITDTIAPFEMLQNAEKSISLKNQLRMYQMISQFYDQLYFKFDIDDYLYSAKTSVHMDYLLNRGLILDRESPHVLYSVIKEPGIMSVLPEQTMSGTLLLNERQAVLYTLPIHPKNNGSILFLVNGDFYDSLLYAPESDMRSTYLFKENQLIVSRANLAMTDTQAAELISGWTSGSFRAEISSEKYMVTLQDGGNGFRYCTMQPMSIFYNKVSSGLKGLLAFMVMLILLSAVVIILLSKRLQRPINALLTLFKHDRSEGDFDVIQKGIQELTNHNQELSGWVEKGIPLQRSELIRNFIRGTYQSKDALVEAGINAGLSLNKKYFAVSLIGISQNMSEQPVADNLLRLFESASDVTGYGTELLSYNQTLAAFFSNSREAIINFAKLYADVGKNLSDSFVMAISNIHDDYSKVSDAYLEVNSAFDNRFIIGDSDLLYFKDISNAQISAPLPQGYMEALKNALRVRDESIIYEAINEIFQYLKSTKQNLFAFRVLYNDIISVLIRGVNPEKVDIQRLYDVFRLSQCLSIQDLDNMLRRVCETLLRNTDYNAAGIHSKMEEAAAYMRENYSDGNLTMNSLAEHLSISSVSLSIEFKELMSMSPSDYLSLLRIERAKKLLRESDLSIKEVCRAVGYYDVPNFTRRFKKYTALTPMQFRQAGKESI